MSFNLLRPVRNRRSRFRFDLPILQTVGHFGHRSIRYAQMHRYCPLCPSFSQEICNLVPLFGRKNRSLHARWRRSVSAIRRISSNCASQGLGHPFTTHYLREISKRKGESPGRPLGRVLAFDGVKLPIRYPSIVLTVK